MVQVSPLGDGGPDDLPSVLRRDRTSQTQTPPTASGRHYNSPPSSEGSFATDDPVQVTVTRLKVPFFNLMLFFLKCTLAAVPAMLLAMAILFAIGQAVSIYAPQLAKVRVLIHVPQ